LLIFVGNAVEGWPLVAPQSLIAEVDYGPTPPGHGPGPSAGFRELELANHRRYRSHWCDVAGGATALPNQAAGQNAVWLPDVSARLPGTRRAIASVPLQLWKRKAPPIWEPGGTQVESSSEDLKAF